MQGAEFWRLSPKGLSLFVRVTPNSGRNSIDEVEERDDGRAVLRVRVAAAPDKGQANAAVLALLSKALHVPKSRLVVTQGETAMLKTILVADGGPALVERLKR